MYCHKCGYENKPKAHFCEKCGTNLTEGFSAAPIDDIPQEKAPNITHPETPASVEQTSYPLCVPARRKSPLAFILVTIAVMIVAGIVVLTVCLSKDHSSPVQNYDDPSVGYSSGSSFGEEDLRRILMQDWDEEKGNDNRYNFSLVLDFGDDKVIMKKYNYHGQSKHTFASSEFSYFILSSSQLAFISNEDYSVTYYDISFNSDKTIMYFQESDDGLEGHTRYTLYAQKSN